ncbi:hypothetical protein AVEN_174243-1 [Araneus ventricosus]|uniref:Uncharacterized protein n=1 Tax=Araneus ventricosus TaxID=182803 RepID=A0A4Y2LE16_ARAVE|nr:hypothetical protein AVEN_174243-1 [Araneus ventricosus]
MMRTTPELVLLSPISRTTSTGWRLTTTCDLARSGSHTVESGFEPRALQPQSQGLAPGPPGPPPPAVASCMASTDHCPRPSPLGFF